ncbi:UvrD-helicase domain-containing protein [Actinomycetes bacterium KLBMP 9797]
MTPDSILEDNRAYAIAQQAQVVATTAPRAVIACPGAGKTRTIIDRHCASLKGRPTGRAIASFTKVAAAQIRKRAHQEGRSDLLEHPHAITTLDGFFWRFLVRPFLPAPTPTNPRAFRRLESWRDAPRELRQIEFWPNDGSRGPLMFDLAEFQFRYTAGGPSPAASLTGLERRERGRDKLTDAQIAQVCKLAEQRRTKLANDERLFTGEETRRAAYTYLNSHADRLATTLARRFDELIVDEAQDCSDTDVELLLRVSSLGLPLLIIADPDQAIYGFRTQGPPAITRLLSRTETIQLNGNWRSSSVICGLAATMRADPTRRIPDVAIADHHDIGHPVHLIAHADGAEVATFHALANAAQIPPAQRFVLAHAGTTLPGLRTGSRKPPPNPSEALVWAVGVLRQASVDHRTRALAEQTLQTAILRHWLPGADRTPAADLQESHEVDRWHLRRLAAHALDQFPDISMTMGSWCAAARAVFDGLRPVPTVDKPAGIRLTTPPDKSNRTAAKLVKLSVETPAQAGCRTDTIHQVKGEEADAVLVLLPDDDRTARLLSRWTDVIPSPDGQPAQNADDDAEALRVLYVAVTRAKRLIALALPGRHIPPVQQHLLGLGVPVETL